MKKAIYFVLFNSLLIFDSDAQNKELNLKVSDYLKIVSSEYKVLISVKNLKGEMLFEQNENEKVASASTIKVPIMMVVMELVKQKEWQLETEYSLQKIDKLEGSQLSKMEDGASLTFRQLLEYMIIYSDNAATNILIKIIGRKKINEQMMTWGFQNTVLNRIMLDFEAAKNGRENYITCGEANQMLHMIYQNKVANKQLCKEMISILNQNDDRETIPQKIPKEIEIAHKTGTLEWVRGDIGLVFSQKPFYISIFVKKISGESIDLKYAEKIIGDISEICFKTLNNN